MQFHPTPVTASGKLSERNKPYDGSISFKKRKIVSSGAYSGMGGDVKYKLSFTVGGIGLQECKTLVDVYELNHDWDVVRERVFDDKSLQVRTESGAKRLIREYVSRLKSLDDEEIQAFRDGTRSDQIAILWLSVCRTYALIGDFAIEVLNERALSSQMEVHGTDFERFIDDKAEFHPEIASIKPSAKAKLRQVALRIMRQAEILSDGNRILPPYVSSRVIELIRERDPSEIRYFPALENLTGAV